MNIFPVGYDVHLLIPLEKYDIYTKKHLLFHLTI